MAKLYFYYSAMNAGKTTTLLQSAFNYKERGMKCLLFVPKVDTRFATGTITSRIGLQSPAMTFGPTFDFLEWISAYLQQSPSEVIKCILIDEAQFMTREQVIQLSHVVDQHNIPVLCYGLRSDFRGIPFDGSAALLGLADKLVELKTICWCGRKATMTMRIDENGVPVQDGEVIKIGGNDCYVATCRKHFFARQPNSPSSTTIYSEYSTMEKENMMNVSHSKFGHVEDRNGGKATAAGQGQKCGGMVGLL